MFLANQLWRSNRVLAGPPWGPTAEVLFIPIRNQNLPAVHCVQNSELFTQWRCHLHCCAAMLFCHKVTPGLLRGLNRTTTFSHEMQVH